MPRGTTPRCCRPDEHAWNGRRWQCRASGTWPVTAAGHPRGAGHPLPWARGPDLRGCARSRRRDQVPPGGLLASADWPQGHRRLRPLPHVCPPPQVWTAHACKRPSPGDTSGAHLTARALTATASRAVPWVVLFLCNSGVFTAVSVHSVMFAFPLSELSFPHYTCLKGLS